MENDVLITRLAVQAGILFENRGYYCSEAIVAALNDGLCGGLAEDRARGLAMGFGEGLGQAGCVCGALAGAVLAASWFLSAELGPAEVRRCSRELHDAFRKAHGSTCCRVLTKPVKHDPAQHKTNCAKLTRHGAELAARLILARMPHLAEQENGVAPPAAQPSRLACLMHRLADKIDGK